MIGSRQESAEDFKSIDELLSAAFGQSDEARIVLSSNP